MSSVLQFVKTYIFGSVLIAVQNTLKKLGGVVTNTERLPSANPKPSTTSHSPAQTPTTVSSVLGIDCEMVGTGRAGSKSMLARVTIVRPHPASASSSNSNFVFSEDDYEVLYDRIVKPENGKKISDYRTKYSGITKEVIRDGLPGVPVVPFSTARSEVASIIAGNIVVGHAVFNDFEALRLVHPSKLTRDTALYPPFMDGQGKKDGRRMRQRKLKYLVEEELGGIQIQNSSNGHSSAEDASAALALYLKHKTPWESKFTEGESTFTHPSSNNNVKTLSNDVTLYLDGSNLGGVGLKRSALSDSSPSSFSLVYNNTSAPQNLNQRTQTATLTVDWVPSLQSLTNSNISPKIPHIIVFWDGAGLKHVEKSQKKRTEKTTIPLSLAVSLHITPEHVEADDTIVEMVASEMKGVNPCNRIVVDVDTMLATLTSESPSSSFFIIRRKAGGTKTHKKTFTKINLRRPHEGAHCLAPITPRLAAQCIATARRLKHEKLNHLVEISAVDLKFVKSIVATDDVLLADRIVKEGGVVLNCAQLLNIL
ncbi:hypothetical protein TL16_g02101 [Triparma laevis f. inornata]|uniref:Exonuclease domain-containing protein n=1 Tax=Triparma laevis f. inornata TaxID=1714386 RepID=A0A9W6ZQ18_9STRA|nr:hypothetical protein TL16_g02101 [Triparma laevis f. inornata]